MIVEPVDAEYRATPPGDISHTVLITNLANHVQPVIRYDLGDSVVASPEPCACGNPLPAIRVEGRREDVLFMPGAHGRAVRLLPLALTTVVEDAVHVHRVRRAPCQVVGTVRHLCGLEHGRRGERRVDR